MLQFNTVQLGAKFASASVTPTTDSLTSSLITFFSPAHELVRVTSEVTELTSGEFQYRTQVRNLSGAPIVFDLAPGPLGCSICPAAQTDCSGTCVDTGSDAANCGSCGNACAADEFCSEGTCMPVCAVPGTTLCGGACVNLASNNQNCGTCGNVCPNLETTSFTCCSGVCTSLTGNNLNCGACGIACPEGFSCQGSPTSSCQCPSGLQDCSGACVDISSSPLNCGACGRACNVPFETCQGGKCVSSGAFCGNGVKDPAEECDGQDLGGQTCVSIGFCGGTLSCDSTCSIVTSGCQPCLPTNCGNGVIDPGEQCDGQNLGGQTCSSLNLGLCGGTLACDSTCSLVTANCGTCGPGLVCLNDTCQQNPLSCTPACGPGSTCVGGVCQPCITGCIGTVGPGASPALSSQPAVTVIQPQQSELNACEFIPQPVGDVILGGLTAASQQRPSVRSIPIGIGGVVTVDCRVSRHPAKEVTSQLTVCGGNIPKGTPNCSDGSLGSQGSVNVFVPDEQVDIGSAFLSPLKVEVRDASGDGLVQPGESFDLFVSLTNAGAGTVTGAAAILSAPDVDLDQGDDAMPASDFDPVVITGSSSPYPDLVGAAIGGGQQNCNTATPLQLVRSFTNTTPFSVMVPADHPSDTAHPFHLNLTGQVAGVATSLGMNFVLGIGSVCSEGDISNGQFDHLEGLLSPLARLVLQGNTIPMPERPFKRGSTLPLRLRLACGTIPLTGRNASAPQIVALAREGTPIDLSGLDLDAGSSNKNGLLFRFDGDHGQWIYNLTTGNLSSGRHVITIQMPNGRNYVAGFVLK